MKKEEEAEHICVLLYCMNVLGERRATCSANFLSVYEQKKSSFTNSESSLSLWDSEASSNNCLSVLPAVFNIE